MKSAMDNMEEVARKQGEGGGDVLSQNYLLAVLNKLQLQGPPPPRSYYRTTPSMS